MLHRLPGRHARPRKQADVLVVNGNPLDDLADLRQVADVFLAGNRIDRQNLI